MSIKASSERILLLYRGSTYHFVAFELSLADGSFYLSMVRSGTSDRYIKYTIDGQPVELTEVVLGRPRPKSKSISYHASGLLRYKNTINHSIVVEPLTAITMPFQIGRFSVPSIERLDRYRRPICERDGLLQIDDGFVGRVDFTFVVAPWNYVADDIAISIRLRNFFSIGIGVKTDAAPVPEILSKYFVFQSPTKGLFERQQIEQANAMIAFHQKLIGTRNLILYSPNGEGIYRVIFAAPMRIAPHVKLHFRNPDLVAEEVGKSTAHLLFRVHDSRGNYLRREVEIADIELDAEI